MITTLAMIGAKTGARSGTFGEAGPSFVWDGVPVESARFDTVDGASVYQDNDAHERPITWDSTIARDWTTSTGKEYLEMVFTSITGADMWRWAFGMKDDDMVVQQDQWKGFGISMSSGAWYIHSDQDTNNGGVALNNEPVGYPVTSTVIGVAFDWDAGKVYVHINGTWGTIAGGNGGEPGVGTGIQMSGAANPVRPFVQMYHAKVGTVSATVQAATSLPSGYTDLAVA